MLRRRRIGQRLADRYGSLTIPVFAVGYAVYGLLMLLDEQGYRGPALTSGPFLYVDRPIWAIAFMAVSLAALVTARYVPAVLLAILLMLWSLSLGRAVLYGPPDVPSGAFLSSAMIAACIHASMRVRGTGGGARH